MIFRFSLQVPLKKVSSEKTPFPNDIRRPRSALYRPGEEEPSAKPSCCKPCRRARNKKRIPETSSLTVSPRRSRLSTGRKILFRRMACEHFSVCRPGNFSTLFGFSSRRRRLKGAATGKRTSPYPLSSGDCRRAVSGCREKRIKNPPELPKSFRRINI